MRKRAAAFLAKEKNSGPGSGTPLPTLPAVHICQVWAGLAGISDLGLVTAMAPGVTWQWVKCHLTVSSACTHRILPCVRDTEPSRTGHPRALTCGSVSSHSSGCLPEVSLRWTPGPFGIVDTATFGDDANRHWPSWGNRPFIFPHVTPPVPAAAVMLGGHGHLRSS